MFSLKLILAGLACFVVGGLLSYFLPAQVIPAGAAFTCGVYLLGLATRRPGDTAQVPPIPPPSRVPTLPETPEAKGPTS